jgi:hypothetical protein
MFAAPQGLRGRKLPVLQVALGRKRVTTFECGNFSVVVVSQLAYSFSCLIHYLLSYLVGDDLVSCSYVSLRCWREVRAAAQN